jgi:hypothetical protein
VQGIRTSRIAEKDLFMAKRNGNREARKPKQDKKKEKKASSISELAAGLSVTPRRK